MKRFISICRALTYASGVIPECFSRESAVAKRRYSVTLRTAKSHGMTSALGGRTAPGFTLIELLVVVLIIGILASVALPQYNKAVNKARLSEVWTTLKAINDAYSVFYMGTGQAIDNTKFEDLDLSFTDANGNAVTGSSFTGKNFTYYLDYDYYNNSAAYAKPNEEKGTGKYTFFTISNGARTCFGDNCKKYGFFRTGGTGCTSGAGAYLTSLCYVE